MTDEPSRAGTDPLYMPMREHIEAFATGYAKGNAEKLEEALDCFAMADATSNEKISTASYAAASLVAVILKRMHARARQITPAVADRPEMTRIWLDMVLTDIAMRAQGMLAGEEKKGKRGDVQPPHD